MSIQVIPVDALPMAKTNRGRPGAFRPHRYDQVYCPSNNDKKPLGFPGDDREDYKVCANSYLHSQVNGLLRSQFADIEPIAFRPQSTFHITQMEMNAGRALISPDVLNNADLRRYVEQLAPYALGKSSMSSAPSQSPLIAQYLLGGITGNALEALCERVMDVFDFPPEERDGNFAHATALVGFGPQADYLHIDSAAPRVENINRMEHEDYKDWRKRLAGKGPAQVKERVTSLSIRQQWLADKIPSGPFATHLLKKGAFDESLSRKISRMKWEVCRDTAVLFSAGVPPEGSAKGLEMTERSFKEVSADGYKYSTAVRITEEKFQRAVERVFKGSWFDLDLKFTLDLPGDVERVMARLIIDKLASSGQRTLSRPAKLHPRTILGMSLLTGVPVGKFIQFAFEDFVRRGETFIDADTVPLIRDLIEATELFTFYSCAKEIDTFAIRFDDWMKNEAVKPISRFTHKLRTGQHKLWSVRGEYHLYHKTRKADDEEGRGNKYVPYLDHQLYGFPSISPFNPSED